ncbi:PIN domain-containing protein [Candidatus Thiosymbion oneisti]|uniref:PIN domain-containing protein n=1 Tax=Candidatus Thiosymbion oneisti TaxID=589554 RepID=UPI00105CAB1B|nr:PIN domain-containing protein [Candidatus Thiosymbion oneisti]
MRVIFDLNVLLDVLLDRVPHATDSAAALRLAETHTVEGYLCAAGVGTLDYLLTRGLDRKQARFHLGNVRKTLHIAAVTEAVIDAALALDWPDLEDAIVHESARLGGVDAIVTRDLADFSAASLAIFVPKQLVAVATRRR